MNRKSGMKSLEHGLNYRPDINNCVTVRGGIKALNIIIGADIVPTDSNKDLFECGNSQELVGDKLLQVLNDSDYRVFNLEVPLTDNEKPIAKCGPNLIASKKSINGYKALKVDLLTLANNHILDQDVEGLNSTISVLKENNIAYVGVGNDFDEAAKPYIVEIDGMKLGFYACAEHEFSIVSDERPGANPIDLLETPDHISMLKKQCDYVIVLYHGGKEHYRYPSPNLQKVCRKLVDKGADLVVCQHSHCIGCEEKYHTGTIVYGQGNFLFDDSESVYWQTSLLIHIGDGLKISYLPLVKRNETVRLAVDVEAQKIIADFEKRSHEILADDFIKNSYDKFAAEMLYSYLIRISAFKRNLMIRAIDKITGHRLIPWIMKRKYMGISKRAVENCINCEAHRELFIHGIRRNW